MLLKSYLERYKWLVNSLFVLMLGVGISASNVTLAGKILFEDTFENDPAGSPPNSNYRRKLNNWGNCSGNCAEITREEARSGKQSLKTYLHREKSKTSYRTEAVPRGPARNHPKFGVDYWYGFSTMIPNGFLPDAMSGDTIAQWHTTKGNPVTLRIDGNNLQLQIRDHDNNKSRSWNLGQYPRGNWIDWVFHAVWSTNSNKGLFEVWKDGKKVVSYHGINSDKDPDAPWMKIGLYKTAWRGVRDTDRQYFDQNIFSRTLYHDEVRIASGSDASYSDVAPDQAGGPQEDELPPPSNLRIISSN